MIVVGAIIDNNHSGQYDSIFDFYNQLPYLFNFKSIGVLSIVTGLCLAFVACLGIGASIHKSTPVLNIYMIMVCVMLIIEVSLGITTIVIIAVNQNYVVKFSLQQWTDTSSFIQDLIQTTVCYSYLISCEVWMLRLCNWRWDSICWSK